MTGQRNKLNVLKLLVVVIICFVLSAGVENCAAAESSESSAAVPTIESLTGGKIKVGDLIDKNNVDVVKDLLPVSVYECVKLGMVLIVGEHYKPEEMIGQYFWDLTDKYKGQAEIVDEYGTVYLKDRSLWPGGLPFPEPKTGLEVMANIKYGQPQDDFKLVNQRYYYIHGDGDIYKTNTRYVSYVWCTSRKRVPPLPTWPGYESENQRNISSFTAPLTMKGLGQVKTRYYNEKEKIDTGFAYVPSFKRAIRVSQTTYQDAIGGSDVLFCDPMGINDPYVYWNFELIGKKFMLTPAIKPHVPWPLSNDLGDPLKEKFQFDVKEKFMRVAWAVTPIHVVEGTPTGDHVYGKRVFYVPAPPYWWTVPIQCVDIYDKQMKIYKAYWNYRGGITQSAQGDPFIRLMGFEVVNLQTLHSSRTWFQDFLCNIGLDPGQHTLKALLEMGK